MSAKQVSIDTFVTCERNNLLLFRHWWHKQQKLYDHYPNELTEAGWEEQFSIFCQILREGKH